MTVRRPDQVILEIVLGNIMVQKRFLLLPTPVQKKSSYVPPTNMIGLIILGQSCNSKTTEMAVIQELCEV